MKNYKITVNGNVYNVTVEESDGKAAPVAAAPAVSAPAPVQNTAAASAGAEIVKAPMPGTILDIKVSAGQQIEAGAVLLVLEAMKMENEIVAPKAGTVDAVLVNKGDMVDVSADLVSIK